MNVVNFINVIRFLVGYVLLRFMGDFYWNFLYKNNPIKIKDRIINPRAQGYLELMASITPSSEYWDVYKVRQSLHSSRYLYSGFKVNVKEIKDFEINNEGFNIPVRFYEPIKRHNSYQNSALVFIHGGGLVTGSIETYDSFCRQLSSRIMMPIFAIDYRLAPEYSLEEIQSDSRFFWKWLQNNCYKFDVSNKKIGLCGESAGASLVLDICDNINLGDNDVKPRSIALIYPPFVQEDETNSRKEIKKINSIIFNDALKWFEKIAIPDKIREEVIARNQRFDPTFFPPVFLLTCGFDPLRDEGEVLLKLFERKSVTVHHVEYKDMFHGFILMPVIFKHSKILCKDLNSFFWRYLK
jgi:acetyl esterase/lipase